MFDLSLELLASIFFGAIVLHLVWWILSTRFPSVYVLAAAFVLLSPFSLSAEIGGAGAIKLGRIYVTILMVILGLLTMQRGELGRTSKIFLVFVFYFAISVMWSDHPVAGLEYKGLFAMLAFSGLAMGASLTSIDQFQRGMRMLLFSSVAWAGLIGIDILQNPLVVGRLNAYTLNPNGIATVSQFEAIICLFVAIYDTSKSIRLLAYATLAMQGLTIVYTGSRGPMAAAVIGGCIMLAPIVRRPGRLLAIGALFAVIVMGLSFLVHPAAVDRLISTEDTRSDVWVYAMEEFGRSPIIGVGWVYNSQISPGEFVAGNLHSIYMTILCELGAIGFLVFIVILFLIVSRAWQNYRFAAHLPAAPVACYCCAVLYSTLVGALAESGTLAGTTVNALFLSFSIGLVDSVSRLLSIETIEMSDEYGEGDHESYDPSYALPDY